MAGFTKLFSDIVDSSIWDEDSDTCKVWVTLLALSDADGFVRGSNGWLAGKSRVAPGKCALALQRFQEPDAKSRTPDEDGRRIEVLEDGWLILNYIKFRERLSNDPKTVATRERVRKHREHRYNALRNTKSVTPPVPASASVSASVPISQYEDIMNILNRDASTQSFVFIKGELDKMFERNGRAWTYEEEYALCDVCRSGRAVEEFKKILSLKNRMSLRDQHFFPRSVISILNNWSKLLDTETTYRPPKTNEEYKAIEAALKRWT